MTKKQSADVPLQYDDEETARRRDEALLRALSTPPKPHSEMKLGKRKAKASTEANPPKKLTKAIADKVDRSKAPAAARMTEKES